LHALALSHVAPESGIAVKVCPTSIEMFGLKNEELLPNLAFENASAFLEAAGRARFSGVF
jgi:peroxiredoxin family protein